MADPPVAQLEQVADRGLDPRPASKRTDGWPRASDSIITTGSEPAAPGGSISSRSSPSAGPAFSASAEAAPHARSLFVSISATA